MKTITAAEQARQRYALKREAETLDDDLDHARDAREIELANELELARAKAGGLERRLSLETAANRELGEQTDYLTAQIENADRQIAELESELNTAREQQTLCDNENQSLRTSLDLVNSENARLSQRAGASEAESGEKNARLEYLETALATAEAACARLTAETGDAAAQRHAEIASLKARLEVMSSRATTAETLYTDARERLVARIEGSTAVEAKLAATMAACHELERGRAELIAATSAVLKTLQDREAALLRAEDKVQHREAALLRAERKIKSLGDRIVELEAAAVSSARRNAAERVMPQQLDDTDDTNEKDRKNWAELARALAKLMMIKRQSAPAQALSPSMLLASTIAF
jgi:chromosome segregation ATPase